MVNWKISAQVGELPLYEITYKVSSPIKSPCIWCSSAVAHSSKSSNNLQILPWSFRWDFLSNIKYNYTSDSASKHLSSDPGGITGMPGLSRSGICRASTRGHRWLRLRGFLPEFSWRQGTFWEGRYVGLTTHVYTVDTGCNVAICPRGIWLYMRINFITVVEGQIHALI